MPPNESPTQLVSEEDFSVPVSRGLESLGDAEQSLDVQAALIRFQPGELGRGDPDARRTIGLAMYLRRGALPEDGHHGVRCTDLAIEATTR